MTSAYERNVLNQDTMSLYLMECLKVRQLKGFYSMLYLHPYNYY